jgi:hypothetical protein
VFEKHSTPQDKTMKPIVSALAGAALLAIAVPVLAQPAPPYAPANQFQPTALPSWMQDDGSSSDYPTPMPSDRSGNPLNAQYRYGIPVPPGEGFPADGR